VQQSFALTNSQSAQQCPMPPGAPPARAFNETPLDTLTHVLNEEGAQKFQQEFFEQIE